MEKEIFDFNLKTKKIIIGETVSDVDIFLKNKIKEHQDKTLSNFKEENILSLAKQILINSGEFKNKSFIDNNLASLLMNQFLEDERKKAVDSKIFEVIPLDSLSLATSKMVYETILKIQLCHDESKKLPNHIKNLIESFYSYLNKEDKLLDTPKILETAIGVLKSGEHDDILYLGNDINFLFLPNFLSKLTLLEDKFLNALLKYYHQEKFELKEEGYDSKLYEVSAYGYASEINFVADNILGKKVKREEKRTEEIKSKEETKKIEKTYEKFNYPDKLNINDVAIYVTDSTYDNLIKAIFENKGIPYKFVNGENGLTNDVIALIGQILDFLSNHYSISDLARIFNNKSINDIYTLDASGHENRKLLSELHASKVSIEYSLKNNKKWTLEQSNFINSIIELQSIVELDKLYEAILNLIRTYCDKNQYSSVIDLLQNKADYFSILQKYSKFTDFDDKVEIIKDAISSIKLPSSTNNNAVLIYNLKNTNYLKRKFNFFVGMSAIQVDSTKYESPLFNDKQMVSISDKTHYIPQASNANIEFEKQFNHLINTVKDGQIYLVYSSYDSVNFKPLGKWAKIYQFDITGNIFKYDYNTNDEEKITKTSATKALDELVMDSKTLSSAKTKFEKISPTFIESMVKCPLNALYKKIYTEENFDEYTAVWLKANEEGTLVHRVCELYFNRLPQLCTPFNQVIFDEVFEKAVKETRDKNPFDSDEIIDATVNRNKKMLIKYFKKVLADSNNKYKVLFTECKINSPDSKFGTVQLTSGSYSYIFNGTIDRIDGYVDETKTLHLRVIDYKTSKPSKFKIKTNGCYEEFHAQPAIYLNLVNYLQQYEKDIITDKLGENYTSFDNDPTFNFVLFKDLSYEETSYFSDQKLVFSKICELIDDFKEVINLNSYKEMEKRFNFNNRKAIDQETNRNSCTYCNFKRHCMYKQKAGSDKALEPLSIVIKPVGV